MVQLYEAKGRSNARWIVDREQHQQPPQINAITFNGASVTGTNPATAAYKPQDMVMMLLPVMMKKPSGNPKVERP